MFRFPCNSQLWKNVISTGNFYLTSEHVSISHRFDLKRVSFKSYTLNFAVFSEHEKRVKLHQVGVN